MSDFFPFSNHQIISSKLYLGKGVLEEEQEDKEIIFPANLMQAEDSRYILYQIWYAVEPCRNRLFRKFIKVYNIRKTEFQYL